MWKVIFQYFGISLKITTTAILRMHHQRLVRHAAVPGAHLVILLELKSN